MLLLVLVYTTLHGPAELAKAARMLVRGRMRPGSNIPVVTCNPKCAVLNCSVPEILAELLPRQKAEERPELSARFFKLKYDAVCKELAKDGIPGQTPSHVSSEYSSELEITANRSIANFDCEPVRVKWSAKLDGKNFVNWTARKSRTHRIPLIIHRTWMDADLPIHLRRAWDTTHRW